MKALTEYDDDNNRLTFREWEDTFRRFTSSDSGERYTVDASFIDLRTANPEKKFLVGNYKNLAQSNETEMKYAEPNLLTIGYEHLGNTVASFRVDAEFLTGGGENGWTIDAFRPEDIDEGLIRFWPRIGPWQNESDKANVPPGETVGAPFAVSVSPSAPDSAKIRFSLYHDKVFPRKDVLLDRMDVTFYKELGPDLIVSSIDVPRSITGTYFALNATVFNQGTESGSVSLYYQRLTDSDYQAENWDNAHRESIGSSVWTLNALTSSTYSVDLPLPQESGTYWYRACVNMLSDESNKNNNCSAWKTVSVTVGQPDLVVDSASILPSNPTTDGTIRFQTKIKNQGEGDSDETFLYYQWMTEADYDAKDWGKVKQYPSETRLYGLTANNTSKWYNSVLLNTPPTSGEYRYRVCVKDIDNESDKGNNCLDPWIKVVVSPPAQPDLVVSSIIVPNSTAGSFKLTATVHNQGNGSSGSTKLYYQRWPSGKSQDHIVRESQTTISGFSPGESREYSVTLTPPSSGSFRYRACVEDLSDESNKDNNCFPEWKTVSVTLLQPDLTASISQISSGTTTSGTVTLNVKVSNQGQGRSSATKLYYQRLTEAQYNAEHGTWNSAYSYPDSTDVDGTSAGYSRSYTDSLASPSTAGTYRFRACVKSITTESNEGNNCSDWEQVVVSPPAQPDLVVINVKVNDSSPSAGSTIRMDADVYNQGNATAPATTLRYYRSNNPTISRYDTELDYDPVSSLASRKTSSEADGNLPVPSDPGTYYYGACVDVVSDESHASNNCSSGVRVDVQPVGQPDLVVINVKVNDSSPSAGSTIRMDADVYNQGNATAPATTLRYYRSNNPTISRYDTELDYDPVSSLASRKTSSEADGNLPVPSDPGTYYYGACVDVVSDESHANNNCSSGVKISVKLPPPPTPTLTKRSTYFFWTLDSGGGISYQIWISTKLKEWGFPWTSYELKETQEKSIYFITGQNGHQQGLSYRYKVRACYTGTNNCSRYSNVVYYD